MNRYLAITVGTAMALLSAITHGWPQATLLPNAQQSFTDNNGAPLANGNVYFYIPNTSTPSTVWTTASESVAQPQPVPLGIAGRPANPIYGSGCYRQVVQDQFSNTIWDFPTCSTGSGGGGTSPAYSEGVMVGTIIPWANTTLPNLYLYTAGQAVSRTTYPQLMTALTFSPIILCEAGIATITVTTDISDKVPIGAAIEATCFAPGTVVQSKTSGQLTMSNAATATTSVTSQIFPWGNGDGATTFNVPDLRGRFLAGRDNMNSSVAGRLTSTYYNGGNPTPDAIAAPGGFQSNIILTLNLPPYSPSGIVSNGIITTTVSGGNLSAGSLAGVGTGATIAMTGPASPTAISTQAASSFTGSAQGGTSSPFGIVPPAITSDFIIKALPDDAPTGPGVTSLGGMTGNIACGANIICNANTVSVTFPVTCNVLGGFLVGTGSGDQCSTAAGSVGILKGGPFTSLSGTDSSMSGYFGITTGLGLNVAAGDVSTSTYTNSFLPTAYVIRTEQLTGTTTAYTAALTVVSQAIAQNSNGSSTSQTQGVMAYANKDATSQGDLLALSGIGTHSGTHGTAFGAFFQATSANVGSTTTGAHGFELQVQNGTGINQGYNPSGTVIGNHTGMDILYVGSVNSSTSALGSAGLQFRASLGQFDVGIGFTNSNPVATSAIRNDDTVVNLWIDNGSHTTGLNWGNGTYSGNVITTPGFTLGGTGSMTNVYNPGAVATPVQTITNSHASAGDVGVTIKAGATSASADATTYMVAFDDAAGTNIGGIRRNGVGVLTFIPSAATNGQTCSGTPTSSFASVGGIVTHC
jgi:hypothetical protein